jgi:hypothetical protein
MPLRVVNSDADDESDSADLADFKNVSKDEILHHAERLIKQAQRLFKTATTLLTATKQLIQVRHVEHASHTER